MQKLIEHGHRKADILNDYSLPEIRILYEKIVRNELRSRADFIEGIMAGIGGCFGGGKEIEKLLKSLRGEVNKIGQ